MKTKLIYNGVPWFDQNGNSVNAHGACILQEGDKYYLFGEYKADAINQYRGFSRYSSTDFTNWSFEGLALPLQKEGRLGPERVGERVKVLKCPKTGKYTMLMHTDDMRYMDPCIGLAVSDTIDGEFSFVGPILYKGEPIKMWDMGTFVDDDGTAYLLLHEGDIYKLNDDYTEAVELVSKNIAPGGESPAMFKQNGYYFILFSNKTSWERNDNYYLTSKSVYGPWEKKGLFCPEGSLTFNTQCSFVFDYFGNEGRVPIYVGDRWSYPKQASAATLVLLPIVTEGDTMRIDKYMSVWSPDNLENKSPIMEKEYKFESNLKGEYCEIKFEGSGLLVFGETFSHGGYAYFEIFDENNTSVHKAIIDFHSLLPDIGLRYVSPKLEKGKYTLKITVSGENGVWSNKKGDRFGSFDYFVKIAGFNAIS